MTLREYLKSIADKFRHELAMADDEKINAQDFTSYIDVVSDRGFDEGYGQGYRSGHDEGKQAEYDALWDKLQPYKEKGTQYAASFGQAWTADIFKPKYDMTVNAAIYMFAYNQIGGDLVEYFERLGKRLDFSGCLNTSNAFQASKFTRLGGIYCTSANWYNCFNGCTELETIDEWGHPSGGNVMGGLTSCFTGCSKLKNLTVKGVICESITLSSCTLLSKASIESVITHLTDQNAYATATFSKTAVNNAFGSTESAAWKALIATKPTWTFSLV